MRLPTAIPDAWHVDLASEDRVALAARDDAMVQTAMIRTHAWLMGQRLGRPVSELEAARDWIESGLAVMYRKHYQRITAVSHA